MDSFFNINEPIGLAKKACGHTHPNEYSNELVLAVLGYLGDTLNVMKSFEFQLIVQRGSSPSSCQANDMLTQIKCK